LLEGIAEYQKRERRYGGLNHGEKLAPKSIPTEGAENSAAEDAKEIVSS
jgi:hypothetical protein